MRVATRRAAIEQRTANRPSTVDCAKYNSGPPQIGHAPSDVAASGPSRECMMRINSTDVCLAMRLDVRLRARDRALIARCWLVLRVAR